MKTKNAVRGSVKLMAALFLAADAGWVQAQVVQRIAVAPQIGFPTGMPASASSLGSGQTLGKQSTVLAAPSNVALPSIDQPADILSSNESKTAAGPELALPETLPLGPVTAEGWIPPGNGKGPQPARIADVSLEGWIPPGNGKGPQPARIAGKDASGDNSALAGLVSAVGIAAAEPQAPGNGGPSRFDPFFDGSKGGRGSVQVPTDRASGSGRDGSGKGLARPVRDDGRDQVMETFEHVRDRWLSEAGRAEPGELARELGREIREFKRLDSVYAEEIRAGREALRVHLMTLHVFYAAALAAGETDALKQTVLIQVEKPLEAMAKALAAAKTTFEMASQTERVAGVFFAQEAQSIHETIMEGLLEEQARNASSRKLSSKDFVALSNRAIGIFEHRYAYMAPSQDSLLTAVYVLIQIQRIYEGAAARRKTLPAIENLVLPILLELHDVLEAAKQFSDVRERSREVADAFLHEKQDAS